VTDHVQSSCSFAPSESYLPDEQEASTPDTREVIHAPHSFDPRLLIWLSPAFPVGAFAYSHGLEWAVERGWVRDQPTLTSWLRDLVALGAIRNDLILLAEAWRCASDGRWPDVGEVNALALALQPSAERHLETVTQGNAFLETVRAVWGFVGLDAVAQAVVPDVAYPIAVGATTAAHGLPLAETLNAFGTAAISNLTSAAIRLSAVGQTDAQRTIAALLPDLAACAAAAERATLDDLGGAVYRSDIASLAHETQYTRLFRS
jgi:urease accessory protein